jgi:hypothetical protein
MFGFPFELPNVRYWGARAIYQKYNIDLLHDRQSFQGEHSDSFMQWLNGYALPWLRDEVKRLWLSTDDPRVIKLWQFKYELNACTNSSYGYLYIGAIEHVQAPAPPYRNSATGKDEQVVVINGQKFVVDDGIVPVGTKGIVRVNNIGPATVVGYFNEKYVDDHSLACLMVDVHSPPSWLIRDSMDREARKLVKEGVIPKSKNSISEDPAIRSKAYQEFKRNWKLKPIPIWAVDFQPDLKEVA